MGQKFKGSWAGPWPASLPGSLYNERLNLGKLSARLKEFRLEVDLL